MTLSFQIADVNPALLIMDYQIDIVGTGDEQQHLLQNAQAVIQEARRLAIPIIYVVVNFRKGYPEINNRNKLFTGLRRGGKLLEGTSGAEIHPMVAPQDCDVIVVKKRVNAFFNTELETILKSHAVDTLILMGIATSGVILSTVRWAADADYSIIVVSDCCHDGDKQVHSLLIEKILPRQADVVSTVEIFELFKDLR